MLNRLIQRLQHAKPEPLSPEQLVGSIDNCLEGQEVAMGALEQLQAGEIPWDEFSLKYDLADMTRQNVVRRLVENGLWNDPKKTPKKEEFIAIRNLLAPGGAELNPDQPTDNVVELDEHREYRDKNGSK